MPGLLHHKFLTITTQITNKRSSTSSAHNKSTAMSRGGHGGGGARGGFGGGRKLNIAGTELDWDISELDIPRGPIEPFPKTHHPPQPPPASRDEEITVQNHLGIRTRIHEGPFYTILNDGMKNGLKRKADDRGPTEDTLFNSFLDNQTYSAKYAKKRRRIPKLDTRPYVVELFPPELHDLLAPGGGKSNQQLLSVTRMDAKSYVEQMIKQEQERMREAEERGDEDEDEDADEDADDNDNEGKPDAVDEDDNWSAASSDSEESGDDYNAEQYFDNGDDDEGDDGDAYGDYD
ncbi:unnamed protein product [Periconia digitata]|uniref:DNA-directed RNA polymerase III subunit n=1 Tax=Periconia digitata TaxID=1303443 RepID=A0A9W4URA3_9PLEO|nr:unnamed protein product [Periconia digitata]